ARAEALIDRINQLRQRLLTERLRTRGQTPLAPAVLRGATAGIVDLLGEMAAETRSRVLSAENSALGVLLRLIVPVALVAVTASLVLVFRRRAFAWLRLRVRQDLPTDRKIAIGLGLAVMRLVVPTVALTIVVTILLSSGLLGEQALALIRGLAATAFIAVATHALAGAYFAPYLPAIRLSGLDDRCARAAQRFAIILGVVWGLDRMLVRTADGLALPEETQIAINLALLIGGGLALWGFERAIAGTRPVMVAPDEADDDPDADAEPEERAVTPAMIRFARMLLLAVAVIAPSLAVAGYFAASRFIFYNPLATAALIGGLVLVFAMARTIVDAAIAMMRGEESAAPTALGVVVTEEQEPRRLRLITVIIGFVLVCAAIPLIAIIWGARRSDLATAWQALRQGVTVGDIVLSPQDFFAFTIIFAIVLGVFKVVQAILSRSVLPLTGLDAGARAAIVSGVGYVGWTLAALVAVVGVGLDLSNVAIIAGALSVGIGFGLQAIVSNFVSGLILLIERPIKVGDWVQLPSGMGYVKRVNVRATEVE
ncbi:MAG: DUF3772 domain-containing protein, partial [Pseudomonadota bacterium]